jgi:succinoglycan biosynthesis protein ExoM
MLVSVCICTYGRLSVVDTINSVLAQQGVSLSDLEIVVGDEDDPKTSVEKLVKEIASRAPIPIRYVVSGGRSIVNCRNALLAAAAGDWIAYIDDDQTAEPNWLAELISAQRKFDADVVKSYVRAVYPPGRPSWVDESDPFTRDFGPTGTQLSILATNGILFRRASAVDNGITFDSKYGSTGGEDADFFFRLQKKGARLISCRTSVANERVPISRLDFGYLRRRYTGDGYNYGRFYLSTLPKAALAAKIAKSVAAVGACCPYLLVLKMRTSLGFRMFNKFWTHLGMLEWAWREKSYDQLYLQRRG